MPLLMLLAIRTLAHPSAMRAVFAAEKYVAGPGLALGSARLARLLSSDESDEELSDALSADLGTLVVVATFDEPFELRRCQATWTLDSGDAAGEDVRVNVHHFLKVSGGNPVDTWDAADFGAVETALTAFWTSIKANYSPKLVLSQYRWYREGPDLEPPLPPVRVTNVAAAGTANVATPMLPPQMALTITERSAGTTHKRWGRFYLPNPAMLSAVLGIYGRPPSAFLGAVADAADTMFEAFETANCPAVLYEPPLPERQRKDGTTLAARPGRALTIDDITVDDVYDVQRRRRYERPLLRVQRQIGA